MSEELERKSRNHDDTFTSPTASDKHTHLAQNGPPESSMNYVDSPVSLPERRYRETDRRGSEWRGDEREWGRRGRGVVRGDEWGRGRGGRGRREDWYGERRGDRRSRDSARGERPRERIVRFDSSTISDEQWNTPLPGNPQEKERLKLCCC